MSKDDRLAQILKHAAKVFFEKGYDRASIRDIARDAQMSLAGLYYYFKSKEEILFLCQREVFSELLQRAEGRLAEIQDPFEKIEAFIANHLAYFIDNIIEMKVLSHEYECLEGEHHKEISALRRDYYLVAESIVEEALTQQGNKADLSPRLAVLSLLGMMNWLYTWYRPEDDGPPERVAAQMTRIFLNGLR